ncbi:transcription factor bHLH113-like isoform X1 [Tasmannia lanceolata]|uniref:transcription factor bHLH113-like isoform X1 n=1 Tax=Tasmannia lanceolata TaxID=3420 RepID=UPI0040636B53
MSTPDDFNGSPISEGDFAQFMESDDVGLEIDEGFIYPSSFSAEKPSKMLCFGDGQNELVMGFSKSGLTGSDSSSNSSRKSDSGEEKSEKKIPTGSGVELTREMGSADSRKMSKKPKSEPSATGPFKVRKEKLGERITALQQLVSPFGKTDTASVLHEAMGYIRFLHDQVQVLSSPYLQRLPSSASLPEAGEEESRYDLSSRGLCLVPVACTVHVANTNGADFWSPVTGTKNSSNH